MGVFTLDINRIGALLENIAGVGNVKLEEPMKNHTSFKLGGAADVLVTPENTAQIMEILEACKREGIPFFIMGNGTNLIVRDKGIRGVVVKLFDRFSKYDFKEDSIEAEAGILLSKLANIALKLELTGLEFAGGIPGTLGGAVAMNAGAYGGEMKDVVAVTEYIDAQGEIKTLAGSGHSFGYRTSLIQKEGGIVLKSRLKLKKGVKQDIEALMEDYSGRRKDKQPLNMPSAGSVFKRPEGYFAGKLIEDSGLKGFRIGGAEISSLHSGFIVNAGGATAGDVTALIQHVQNEVKKKFDVHLQTEVKIVGEE